MFWDNGTDFAAKAMIRWEQDHGVDGDHLAPGGPIQDGLVESFIGCLYGEPLNEQMSTSRPHAPEMIQEWRNHY